MTERDYDGKYSNFYTVLGVSPDADREAIKKAYKKIVSNLRRRNEDDEERFKIVSKAYDVLCDENKRRRYNNTLCCSRPQPLGASAEEEKEKEAPCAENMVTVYTIGENGCCFTEKVKESEVPASQDKSVYVLSTGGGRRAFVAKELWNRWLDLCDILKSKNAITRTVGDVYISVELIVAKDGKMESNKTKRRISQLPVNFPKMIDPMGKLYGYIGENGRFELLDKYEWKMLNRRCGGDKDGEHLMYDNVV